MTSLSHYWARRELKRLMQSVAHVLVEHAFFGWQKQPWCVASLDHNFTVDLVVFCKWEDDHLYDTPNYLPDRPSCKDCDAFAHRWHAEVGYVGKDRRR